MSKPIFCPNDHLMLDADRCPRCGWMRSPDGLVGEWVWQAQKLGDGLGGAGRRVYAGAAASQGVAVFPLRTGELVGVGITDGAIRWRVSPASGLITRKLLADGNRLLCTFSDERPLEEAGTGCLASLDAESGEITPLWQAAAALLSPLCLTDRLILLRSSNGELLAFSRQPCPELTWRTRLGSWWPLAPYAAENIVVAPEGRPMHGEALLRAFELATGTPLWQHTTHNLVSYEPQVVGGLLIYRESQQQLVARRVDTGELAWQRSCNHLYSNLLASGEWIYTVIRDPASSGQVGYYLLIALHAAKNEIVMEAALPGRGRVLQLAGETLLVGDDDGRVVAYHPSSGERLWQVSLGSVEDPIQTELLVAGGVALFGTYSGLAAAVQVSAPAAHPPDEALAVPDNPRLAAEVFALQGDFRRSAQFYQQLGEPEKAYQLYEHAGLFAEAGTLASALEDDSRALAFFTQAGDLLAQAQAHLKLGDELEAARCLEQAGEFHQAAILYEQAAQPRKALELYRKTGDVAAMLRLSSLLLFSSDDIEYLVAQGKPVEAAQAALKAGLYEIAVKIYQQSGQPEAEYAALQQLCAQQPEPWALEKLAEMARQRADFAIEAHTWEQLAKPDKAALAYHKAARQREQRQPEDEATIIHYYKKAEELFREIGDPESCDACGNKLIFYRREPYVQVLGEASSFREMEFSPLKLTIENVGYGVAHDITIKPRAGRFELDENSRHVIVKSLSPGKYVNQTLYLRPKRGEIGDTVPLVLEWQWRDIRNKRYQGSATAEVKVRSKDSISRETPGVINIGTLIQGDLVNRDKVAGDVQKGDRVEINHGQPTVRLAAGAALPTAAGSSTEVLCPNCSLPVEDDDRFCDSCGAEIPKKRRRKT